MNRKLPMRGWEKGKAGELRQMGGRWLRTEKKGLKRGQTDETEERLQAEQSLSGHGVQVWDRNKHWTPTLGPSAADPGVRERQGLRRSRAHVWVRRTDRAMPHPHIYGSCDPEDAALWPCTRGSTRSQRPISFWNGYLSWMWINFFIQV